MSVEVLVSWSGDKSRIAAVEIASALPKALPHCKPWISTHDIPSGARWSDELSLALGRCTAAVLLLTAENVNNPWVLFEAGAISRPVRRANVIPLLVDIEPELLPAPLAQFQSERLNEAGFMRVCAALEEPATATSEGGESTRRAREAWLAFAPAVDRIKAMYRATGPQRQARAYYLSHSEMKVLELLARGLSPALIAKENGTAISTVRTQINALRYKLQATSVAEIVDMARQNELLLE